VGDPDRVRLHLDTDLGGDPDDACALALLLGWPGVELTGITTSIDPGGWRAAYAEHVLQLAGRAGVPVVPGAERSSSHDRIAEPDHGLWPAGLTPAPTQPGAATALLRQSIDAGAVVVSIGPYTNLAALGCELSGVPVTVMGGWVDPPRAGLPPWGPERDFNVQWDVRAAQTVAAYADLTLVTLPAALQAPLRRADLARLRAGGALGELLAAQSEAHAVDSGKTGLGPAYDGLPDDLLNFHYDPVACAVALGWSGVTVETESLTTGIHDGVLHWRRDARGRLTRVVTAVDGPAFTAAWLSAVEHSRSTSRTRSAD